MRSGSGGPGPNAWDPNNVWVDTDGYLHLKITHSAGQWTTAEIVTEQRLGFGSYRFQVLCDPGKTDKNVVLGLYKYPTPDVGPDGTNEIDIEFATWGGQQPDHGNWTVWPTSLGTRPATQQFDTDPDGEASTHRFIWSSNQISFEASSGLAEDAQSPYLAWTFAPLNPLAAIPQAPTPLHMNLWLFQGRAPSDNQEVEFVFPEFKYTPQ